MATLFLLRHAESAFDPTLPEPDWPLSDRGRRQAQGLVPTLSGLGVGRVFSSPYLRAIDTVRPFCMASGLALQVEPDLHERRLSPEPREDFRELVAHSWADLDFSLPGCESARQCQARVVDTVERLTAEPSGEPLLLSSHGNAIGLFIKHLEPSFGFEQWRAMAMPDLLRVDVRVTGMRWDAAFHLALAL